MEGNNRLFIAVGVLVALAGGVWAAKSARTTPI